MEISVIVTVYNIEKYLKNTIMSVLGQSYINYELILIDDFSSDNSGVICDSFAKQDNRVKVVHNSENYGGSKSSYIGLQYAKNDWVFFLDHDDLIHPQYLELLVAGIDDDIDVVHGRRIDLYDNEISEYRWEAAVDLRRGRYSGKYMCEHCLHETKNKMFSLVSLLSGKLYRKSLLCSSLNLKEYGKYFSDYLFTPMILHYSRNIEVIDIIAYIHREVATSVSRSRKVSGFQVDQIEAGTILLEFVYKHGYLPLYRYYIYDYFRIILRIRVLLMDEGVNNHEIIDAINKKYNQYLRRFLLNASCSVKYKVLYLLYKINGNLWAKLALYYYKRGLR